MTLAAWVYIGNYGSGRVITKQAYNQRGWSLNIEDNGAGSFQIAQDALTLKRVDSRILPLGQWVHLAGVYEPGAALRVYVNGILDNSLVTGIPLNQYDAGNNANIG